MSHVVDQAILPQRKDQSELVADKYTQIRVEKIQSLRDKVEGVVVGVPLRTC